MAATTRLAHTELWCPRTAAHLRPQKAARRQANGDVEREPYIARPRCATIELGGGCSGMVRPAPT